jgi:hypothetical protein
LRADDHDIIAGGSGKVYLSLIFSAFPGIRRGAMVSARRSDMAARRGSISLAACGRADLRVDEDSAADYYK